MAKTLRVDPDTLKAGLQEAKKNDVRIAICRRSGHWSDEYFDVDEIKQIQTANGELTALILEGNSILVIDLRKVIAVRFSTSVVMDGELVDEMIAESHAFPGIS